MTTMWQARSFPSVPPTYPQTCPCPFVGLGHSNVYPAYSEGRPSSLALEHLHKLNMQYLEDQGNVNPDLWRAPSLHYMQLSSQESLINRAMPSRQWGSWLDPRKEECMNSAFMRRQDIRERTNAMIRGYLGTSYRDRMKQIHLPEESRFRLGSRTHFWENLYQPQQADLYQKPYPNTNYAKPENLYTKRQLKWKVLNKDAPSTCDEQRNGRMPVTVYSAGKEAAHSLKPSSLSLVSCGSQPRSSWELPNNYYTQPQTKSKGHSSIRREPQDVWNWSRSRIVNTGPPLKTHLEDEDLRLFRVLQSGVGKKKQEVVANLPWRFKFCRPTSSHTSHHHACAPVKSTASNLAKKGAIKHEIQTLYRRMSSSTSGSVPLEEKTSPVFFAGWKESPHKGLKHDQNERQTLTSVSSTSTQTYDDQCEKLCQGDFTNFKKQNIKSPVLEHLFQRKQSSKSKNQVCDAMLEMVSMLSDEDSMETLVQPEMNSCSSGSGVKLTKEGYYCKPDVKSLDRLPCSRDGKRWVSDFEVGHCTHGKMLFPGYTNVQGLDLDKIVEIRERYAEVYPDGQDRPPFGEGLHKRCIVTLFNVWPLAPTLQSVYITDPKIIHELNYERYLRKVCSVNQKTFRYYCALGGRWCFVIHELPGMN